MSWFASEILSKLFPKSEAGNEADSLLLKPIETFWFDYEKRLERRFGVRGNVAPLKFEDHMKDIKDKLGVTVNPANPLGKGSFGKVYKCKDLLRREFALKIMSPRFDDDHYLTNFFIKMTQQEIYHTANLKHDHIIRMFGHLTLYQPYHTILKLELLGESLDKLGKHPLIKKNIQKIVIEIGSAIKYMHSQATAHHDIKLENIMVTSKIDSTNPQYINEAIGKLKLKLSDFGCARKYFTVPPVESKFRSGTPTYRSPEKCDAPSYDPFNSDYYAFGCTLFIAFVGWNKFESEGKLALWNEELWDEEDRLILSKFAEMLFKKIEGYKDEKEAIIGLLEYDPNRRWTIDQVVNVFK